MGSQRVGHDWATKLNDHTLSDIHTTSLLTHLGSWLTTLGHLSFQLMYTANQVWVFLLKDDQFPTDTLSCVHSSFCPLELPLSSLFPQLLVCYVGIAKNFVWILLSEKTFSQPTSSYIKGSVKGQDKWISTDGAASGTGSILSKLLLIILLLPQCSQSWRSRKWIDTQRVTIQSI